MSLWSTIVSWFKPKPPTPFSVGFASHKRVAVGTWCVLADTGSMLPKYRAGDQFMVEAADFDRLPVGEIAVYWSDKTKVNIPHRIIGGGIAGNGERYYYVKGDANAMRDATTLTRDNFIGVARFFKDSVIPTV